MPPTSASRGRPRRVLRVPARRSATQSPPPFNSSVPDQSPPEQDAATAGTTTISPLESSCLDTAPPSPTPAVPSLGTPLTSEPPNDTVLDAPAIVIEPPPDDVVSDSAHSQSPLGLGNPNSASESSGGKTKRVVKRTVRVIRRIVKKVPKRIVKGGANPRVDELEVPEAIDGGIVPITDTDSVSCTIGNSEADVPLSMDIDKLQQNNGNEQNLEVQAHNEGVKVTLNAENSGPGVPLSMEVDELQQKGDPCEENNGNEQDLGIRSQNEGGLMEVDQSVESVECRMEERKEVLGEALDVARDGEKGTEESEVKEGHPSGAPNAAANGDRNEEKRVDEVIDGDHVAKPEDEMGEGTYYSGEMGALERRRRRKTEIFVGGLDNDAKEEDIRKVFEEVGELLDVRLMMNGSTGKNKGFAFLRYASAVDAKKALEKFSSVKVCGKHCGAKPIEGNDTIHLGGIDKKWKEENIAKLLQEIGIEGIDTILVMKDPQNKELNRGYAFVEFETCRDAQVAFKKLQKKDVFGKSSKMKVAWAGPLNEPNEAEMQKVKTVYAEYIPLTWDEKKVKENFKSFGEIDNVVLAKNLRIAKRKDYAFIIYKTREAAIACIESFKHQPQNGEGTKMNVKVSLARPVSSSKQPKQISKPSSKEIPVVRPKLKQGNVFVRQFDPINAAYVRNLDPRNSAINLAPRQIDPRYSATHATVRQIDPRNSAAHVTLRQIDPRHTDVSSLPHYDIHRPEFRHTVVHRDERYSTTSELVHDLREQASWRPPHPGPLDIGHPTTCSGRKRPVSTLDPDTVYSDMSRYPNRRLQTSLLERYGAHPESSTSSSSAYYQGQDSYASDLPYNGARNYLGSEPRDRAHGSSSSFRRY